jgi:hypothetical protein
MKSFKIYITIILTLLGVSLTYSLSAQAWGEIGTKWVYQRVSQNELRLVKYEITKDTVIDNIDSKILHTSLLTYFGIDTMVFYSEDFLYDLYLSSEGDSIFWYNDGNFEFLYDFSPSINDVWETQQNLNFNCMNNLSPEDSQKVLSISNELIDGNNIEVINLLSGYSWNFGDKIYRNIGPQTSLFPQPGDNCSGIDIASSIGVTTSLVCFYSEQTGNIQFFDLSNPNNYIVEGYTGCEELVSVKPMNGFNHNIYVYPNPLRSNELYIDNQSDFKLEYVRFFDVTGKFKMEYYHPAEMVNISAYKFSNGIYFMQFIGEDNSILQTKKIIINHE